MEVEDEEDGEGEGEEDGDEAGAEGYTLTFRWGPVVGPHASQPVASLRRRPPYSLTAEVTVGWEPGASGPSGELKRALATLPADFANLVLVSGDETAVLVAVATAVSGKAAKVPPE